MKQKIKNWYKCCLWTKQMVRNAVLKGVITESEYAEITGEPYSMLSVGGGDLSRQL